MSESRALTSLHIDNEVSEEILEFKTDLFTYAVTAFTQLRT
jgi:hypothetical protein